MWPSGELGVYFIVNIDPAWITRPRLLGGMNTSKPDNYGKDMHKQDNKNNECMPCLIERKVPVRQHGIRLET
jgi:hypothetical protein